MISKASPITGLKGIGTKTAQLFEAKGIRTVGELLDFYPRDYEYFTEPVTVDQLKPGQMAAVTLTIVGNGSTVHTGGYRITNFHAADATGQIRLTYFNQPYLMRTVRAGTIHVFRGMVRQYKNGNLQLDQPSMYSPAEYDRLKSTFQPRYSLTKGLKNSQVIRAVEKAIFAIEHDTSSNPSGQPFRDYLTEEDLVRMDLMEEWDATKKIHFPSDTDEMVRARNRKVFDEFFAFLLAIRRQKAEENAAINPRPMIRVAETGRLIEELPYELTDSQKKAWEEIQDDLTGKNVMNRLLQGDVGSGKTILAFLSLLMCAVNGHQGALMAPTEVLAEQHMRDMTRMVKQYHLPLKPCLLTGAVKGKARQEALQEIEDGTANVIIGTHALIQEKVVYKDLDLVITDEQHRFGVRQREALAGKGAEVPVLVMSATPIPRTLSIILYGDLQVSRLTELPKNRLPIKNLAIPSTERGRVYKFILKQIAEGRQVYVICPEVGEDGDDNGLPDPSTQGEVQNVRDYTAKIRRILPEQIRIASLNGRMKPAEKDRIMTAFGNHDIDILVSTTVIEVGINVPNATVILIENAERFGLSQLHQLRGRVGRGKWQSYCIFMYEKNASPGLSSDIGTAGKTGEQQTGADSKPRRLKILEKTNDGFAIAEEDLKLRGPGDLFGVRQSGEMGFRLADIYEDADILTKAAGYVDEVMKKNPDASFENVPTLDLRSI